MIRLRGPGWMVRLSLLVACALLPALMSGVGPVRSQSGTLGAPSITSVTVGDTAFTLAWSEPTVTGSMTITSYDVRHIASAAPDKGDTYWIVVEGVWDGGDHLYVLHGLVNGTGHDVQVRAAAGTTKGPWSATSTATPTDFGDTTRTATSITPDTPVGGAISQRYEQDYVRITVSRSTDVVAYTTGDTDTVGTLFDSRGNEVADNDDGGLGHGARNFMIGRVLAAGTYYLRVTGFLSDRGSYTLHVQTGTDTTATTNAAVIGPDEVAFGVITSDKDSDYFKLDLAESTDLIIRTEGRIFDTLGEVLNSEGTSTHSGDVGYLPPTWSHFLIRTRLGTGVHYIEVKGFPGDHGAYFLHVEKVTEPGSNVAGAVPLTPGQAAGGRIDPASDADYFRIDLASDAYLTLAGASEDVDIKGELLDENGGSTGKTVSEEVFETGGPWGILFRGSLDAGTYILKVTSSGAAKMGPYTVLALPGRRGDAEYDTFRNTCKQIVTDYSDPLYGCQWHLNNTGRSGGTAGEDANVEDVWDTYLGTGVPIAIVDDSMHLGHPDLVDNVDRGRSHNYLGGEPFHYSWSHSTKVAGVAAARDNAWGVRGAAPRATLYSYNLLHANTVANIADAMTRNLATTGVSNNSWGFPDRPVLDSPSRVWELAVDRGVTAGYGGKGIFYAWAAGNGYHREDNSNLEGYTNYYAVTAVCAVNDQGERSGLFGGGANLWVCAPSSDSAA